MIAPRGTNIVELDRLASTANQPYGIITADCSNPKEIDDGIFVQELPSAQEMYRVGVCVVDASKLYDKREILNQAMTRTEAKYWDLGGNERGYDPMIDEDLIKKYEFTAGHVRSALVVSFVVGADQPPTDLDVSFGKVEVTKNYDYLKFGSNCRPGEMFERFGRASAFIMGHLKYTEGGDNDAEARIEGTPDEIHNRIVYGLSERGWLRGSRINEAFMVAANHLVGSMMAAEGRPAIYRVHNPDDEAFMEFLPPNVAQYSWKPGLHAGLNLTNYCRVTSPLRRLEDLLMHHELWLRNQGIMPTEREEREIAVAVRSLNSRVIQSALQQPWMRIRDPGTLGKNGRIRVKSNTANVVPLMLGRNESAIA